MFFKLFQLAIFMAGVANASQFRAHLTGEDAFTGVVSCGSCGDIDNSVVLVPADVGSLRIPCCTPVTLSRDGVKEQGVFTHTCPHCNMGSLSVSKGLYEKLNPGGSGAFDVHWD
ncbi:hypothetical protein PM082_000510 [Marasmius tenuissimus]|nr:hypothetical protein PM082_000510 [Marasmius tenuissimus]